MYLSDTLLIVISFISALYFLSLVVRNVIKTFDFCPICFSVSATWVTLLTLNTFGYFSDRLVIALLMGQSITGIFYLAEKRAKEDLRIFNFPFLLTLTFLGYVSLNMAQISINTVIFLIGLWFVFLVAYLFRSDRKIKKIAGRIIECCKNW